MRIQVQSLALLSGLRIGRCHELWCRLQMWLGSGIAMAVAVAGNCCSNLTPSLGTSTCHGCSPKKKRIWINKPTVQDKIFMTHISNKKLISSMYWKLISIYNFNNEKTDGITKETIRMANKHMIKYLTSLDMREMNIQTSVRCYCARMTRI